MRGVVAQSSLQSDNVMRDPMLGHVQRKPRACAACTSFRLSACSVLVTVLGVVLLLVATFVPKVIETKLNDGLADFVSLSPDAQAKNSEGYRTWVYSEDPDSQPIYQNVWMYNITNPAEVVAGGKPHVTEHGPYAYRQVKKKFDISYTTDDNNYEVVQFKERVYYLFQSDMTPAGLNPLTDKYTTLNFATMAVLSVLNNTVPADKQWFLGFDGFLFGFSKCKYTSMEQYLFDSLTVDQVMYGYQGCAADPFPGIMDPNILPDGPDGQTDAELADKIAYDQIYTGGGAPEQARQYLMWKNMTYTDKIILDPKWKDINKDANPYSAAWGTPEANRVYGTSGDQFARDLKEGGTVRVWVDQLMRHAPLINVATTDVHGIKLLKYAMDPKLLKNATQVPDNAAFFMDRFNGLQNLSSVKSTINIQMSKPHFLDADVELFNSVTGLTPPNRDLHDTSLDVEPRTGISMRVGKRLQVNYFVAPWTLNNTLAPAFAKPPSQWFSNMGNNELGGTILPLAWIDEQAEISSSKASDFKSQVYGADNAIKYVRLVGGIVGAIVIAVAAVLFILARNRAWDEADEAREIKDMHAQQQY